MVAARDAWEKALDMLSPSSPAGYGVRVHNALGSLFLELLIIRKPYITFKEQSHSVPKRATGSRNTVEY